MQDRDEALQEFQQRRTIYEGFVSQLEILLASLCESLSVHMIKGRVKDDASFQAKSFRKVEESDNFKYAYPNSEIEDIAGLRIICFSKSQVDDVKAVIVSNFDVVQEIDKAAELVKAGKVGYESHHFVIAIDEPRSTLPEYRNFGDLKCEVQVRTVFQHAWAEVEHRLRYKSDRQRPELVARFQALAGLVQIADREFDQLFELERSVAEPIAASVDEDVDDDALIADDEGLSHKLSVAAGLHGLPPKVLVRRGAFEKAIEVYDQLIGLQPNQSWHFVGRARAKALSGRTEAALADLEKVSEINADDPRIQTATRRLRDAIATSEAKM